MFEIYKDNLPHRAVAVYLYLKSRADKNNKCYPAIGTIASDLSISKSTAKRAISDLVKYGYIRKEKRWRENGGCSSCMYYIEK